MIIWVILILVMGLLLLFFPQKFVENPDWIKQIGLAITLICIGISVRMNALRRRGTREKAETKIRELEKEIESLRSKLAQQPEESQGNQ
ncbi:MAG: hypothetical protein NC831_03390 [Candidatus Omnitrophica bacterium]|nr:hypothetical protein [Candidatus Omnitrophota bacterium]MCM8827825.1 hypothetical protein [Candidatus Omnitrophota bacterium]